MDGISPADLKEISKLYKAGVHLGHKKNRLHPKARKYVYRMEQGVSIIDLTMTLTQIASAKKYLAEAAKEGKVMLVVATKKVANHTANELCIKYGIPYISTKWLSGLLTNFQTIIKNVKNLNRLKDEREKGEWESFVKHERVKLDKKVSKLEKFYKGLVTLEKKPDLLLLVDAKKEKNALTEAAQSGTPTVAIADTNANPDLVDYPVVANDDSPAAVEYVVTELIEAYAKNIPKIKTEKVKEKTDSVSS